METSGEQGGTAAGPGTGLQTPVETIVFDTASGISLEEQEEILKGISAMAGGHRLNGSRLVSETVVTRPKKKGFLFPLFVNISALILLGAGFVLLSFYHVNSEQKIRGTGAALGSTERMLIQEIRQETNQAAMEELSRLDAEQERVNSAETQMNGFYVTVNNHIANRRMNEASRTLGAMREFLDAPSFQGIRSLEARKQTHLAAITAMERAVSMSRGTAQNETLVELKESVAQNTVLEEKAADLERELAALGSQNSDQARTIAENRAAINRLETANAGQQRELNRLEAANAGQQQTLNQLQTANANQQQALNRRDSEIQTLRTDMTRQVSELNRNIIALQTQNAELQRQNYEIQRRMEAAIKAFTEED